MRVEFIEKGFSIVNYYWTQEDYILVMNNAGLKLMGIYQPLGLKGDKVDWKDEKLSLQSQYT